MGIIQNIQYTQVFTPRFNLSDATLVGLEVKIKQRQRILTANDAFKLIQSGNERNLLAQINSYLSQWCNKAEKTLYLSWELCSKTNSSELKCFLDELSLGLPLSQLEIVLDAHDLTANEALDKAQQLFDVLPDKGIRRGLFHSRLLEFDVDKICATIEMLKLKKGAIREMKEDLAAASHGYYFIERLNTENIDTVADGLHSREEATSAILMGIKQGQGFFLSRNQTQQKNRKTLVKKSCDIYERRFDCFQNLLWV
jgi:EAL domain-containing protein (putative c-di-GMP-specific phosphodiesterase class I)